MASYRKRDLKYFIEEKNLPSEGFDPEKLQDEHVTESECVKVWGPMKPNHGFHMKTSDSDTLLDLRVKELKCIIYEVQEVYEFGLKFAKAVLAESKRIAIDWATYAANYERKRQRNQLRKRAAVRTLSEIHAELDSEEAPRKKKNKVLSMRMEDEDVENDDDDDDDGVSVYISQTNSYNEEDEEEMPMIGSQGLMTSAR